MALEDLLAAIEAGPGGGEAVQQGPSRPIGIPESFRPSMYDPSRRSASGGPAPRFVPDPYYDGAEYAPRNLSPESRARLQSAMAQAGLIGKNDTYRLGVWDETSVKAYKKVLAYANQGGLRWEQALEELRNTPQMNADGLEVGLDQDPGRVTAATSALTLEAQIQAAAQARLGRKLKSSEVAKFVNVFQGMEGSFNTTASVMQDEAAATGQDATVEDIPSPDVAADQFIDSNFAQEAAGQDAYGYLGALRNLIGA